jgi:hypothetical protein
MPGETVAIEGSGGPVQPALTPDEQALIGRVDRFLTDGIALKYWWDETSASNGFAERFDLGRSFNRPDESYGFFDQVRLGHGRLEVMGNYQEMFYDQPRSPSHARGDAADWMREQVREFVLRYFMRVSDFRQPEAFVDPGRRGSPPFLSGLSWCARPEAGQVGFGFSQLFYKLRGTGEVGRFRSEDEHAIVDLREIGRVYEWILVKVRIFDFRFSFKPLGPDAFDMGLPLKEESYLVLSGEFIVDERGAGLRPGRVRRGHRADHVPRFGSGRGEGAYGLRLESSGPDRKRRHRSHRMGIPVRRPVLAGDDVPALRAVPRCAGALAPARRLRPRIHAG